MWADELPPGTVVVLGAADDLVHADEVGGAGCAPRVYFCGGVLGARVGRWGRLLPAGSAVAVGSSAVCSTCGLVAFLSAELAVTTSRPLPTSTRDAWRRNLC